MYQYVTVQYDSTDEFTRNAVLQQQIDGMLKTCEDIASEDDSTGGEAAKAVKGLYDTWVTGVTYEPNKRANFDDKHVASVDLYVKNGNGGPPERYRVRFREGRPSRANPTGLKATTAERLSRKQNPKFDAVDPTPAPRVIGSNPTLEGLPLSVLPSGAPAVYDQPHDANAPANYGDANALAPSV